MACGSLPALMVSSSMTMSGLSEDEEASASSFMKYGFFQKQEAARLKASDLPFREERRHACMGKPLATTSKEEKRALRRHRRQLARIVVDHWIYLTRMRSLISKFGKFHRANLKRLYFRRWRCFIRHKSLKHTHFKKATAFNECTLQRLCIRAWKCFIRHKQIKHKNFSKAVKCNKCTLKKKGWQAWVAYFKLQQKLQLASGYLSRAVGTWICRKGFIRWSEYSRRKILHQKNLLKANQFWTLSTLSTFFMNWQLGIETLNQRNYVQKLALGFWAHKRLSIAWKGLKVWIKHRHAISRFSQKVRQRWMQRALQSWYKVSIEENMETNEGAVYGLKKLMLAKALLSWKNYVYLKKQIKQMKINCLLYYKRHLISHAWKALHDYKSRRKARLRLEFLIRSIWKRTIMKAAFNNLKTTSKAVTAAIEQEVMDYANSQCRQRSRSRFLNTRKKHLSLKKALKIRQDATLHLEYGCYKALKAIIMYFLSPHGKSGCSIPKAMYHVYVNMASSSPTVSQWYQEEFRERKKMNARKRYAWNTQRKMCNKRIVRACRKWTCKTRWNRPRRLKQNTAVVLRPMVLDSKCAEKWIASQVKLLYRKCLQKKGYMALQGSRKTINLSRSVTLSIVRDLKFPLLLT